MLNHVHRGHLEDCLFGDLLAPEDVDLVQTYDSGDQSRLVISWLGLLNPEYLFGVFECLDHRQRLL